MSLLVLFTAPDTAPADPCLGAPLTFTVTRWPAAASGSHRFEYTWTGTGPIQVQFTPSQATATNAGGCVRTVTKVKAP